MNRHVEQSLRSLVRSGNVFIPMIQGTQVGNANFEADAAWYGVRIVFPDPREYSYQSYGRTGNFVCSVTCSGQAV